VARTHWTSLSSVIHLKRACDEPEAADGRCYLVDRLWTRGMKKEALSLDGWLKEVAPSDELRRWFAHDLKRWIEFQRRYRNELDEESDSWQTLLTAARQGDLTLVYGARDTEHNNAVVLKAYLREHLTP